MLISTFGHGSEQPAKAALVRIVCLGVAALGMGLATAKAVSGMPLQTLPSPLQLILPAAVSVQVLALGCLLSVHGAAGRSVMDTWGRLLLSLPVRPRQRQRVLMMPQIMFLLLGMGMFGVPLGVLFMRLGVPLHYLACCFAVGLLSAMGIVRIGERMPLGVWMAGIAVGIYGEYAWLAIIVDSNASTSDVLVAQTGASLCLALTALRNVRRTVPVKAERRLPRRSPPLPVGWLARKIMRTPALQRSFGITFCMSLGVVAASHKLSLQTTELYAGCGALLGAAFCADLRAVARKRHMPESYVLKGSLQFVHRMVASGACYGVLAISPLLWSLYSMAASTASYLVVFAGIAAGVCASVCIAPASRDVSGQCSAVLLACGLLFGLPQVLPASIPVGAAHAISILLFGACSYGVEYIRNPYYWMNHVENKYSVSVATSRH